MSNQSFHQQKTNCCSVFFQTLDLETSTMPVSLCPRGVEENRTHWTRLSDWLL